MRTGSGSSEHPLLPHDLPADIHETHVGHMHVHGADCGHEALPHGEHLDYVHGEHRHHLHEHHYDEHHTDEH